MGDTAHEGQGLVAPRRGRRPALARPFRLPGRRALLALTATGATLTVLRGPPPSARPTARRSRRPPSRMTIGVGDQVSTLATRRRCDLLRRLGARARRGHRVDRPGDGVAGRPDDVSIQSVFGSTIHRVVTLTDPAPVPSRGWRHRALVRGADLRPTTMTGAPVTSRSAVATANRVPVFPGMTLRRGERRTYTARGDIRTDSFDPPAPCSTRSPVRSPQQPGGGQIPARRPAASACPSSESRPRPATTASQRPRAQPPPVRSAHFLTAAPWQGRPGWR